MQKLKELHNLLKFVLLQIGNATVSYSTDTSNGLMPRKATEDTGSEGKKEECYTHSNLIPLLTPSSPILARNIATIPI